MKRHAKIHDISLEIKPDMIVYPGNPSPRISRTSTIPENKVNESIICIGSHCGTHVDTPRHVRANGGTVLDLPLDSFHGKCKVLDLTHVEESIGVGDLEVHDIEKGDIILLKTRNSLRGFDTFRRDFIHLRLDGAKYLVRNGVKTLGIDYLSVKRFGGDDEVHDECIMHMTLFEGLDLSEVEPGQYIFAGLPLKIDCDGGPARAILVELDG